jgi:uncharacterized RDD family membrane protein YckC
MSRDNPYAAPEAELEFIPEMSGLNLATRGRRLIAALIDWLIGFAFQMSLYAAFTFNVRPGVASFSMLLIGLPILEFLFFLAVHGYLLKKIGQTVGKKLTGIRIVDLDGDVPSFGRLIGLRYLPIFLIMRIPFIGPFSRLLDVLFIFRSDRRCLHDLLAGTRVVTAWPSEDPIETEL